jgi:hypothetical protein
MCNCFWSWFFLVCCKSFEHIHEDQKRSRGKIALFMPLFLRQSCPITIDYQDSYSSGLFSRLSGKSITLIEPTLLVITKSGFNIVGIASTISTLTTSNHESLVLLNLNTSLTRHILRQSVNAHHKISFVLQSLNSYTRPANRIRSLKARCPTGIEMRK